MVPLEIWHRDNPKAAHTAVISHDAAALWFAWPARRIYVHVVITSGLVTPNTPRETSPYSGRSCSCLSETLAYLQGPAAGLADVCCDNRNEWLKCGCITMAALQNYGSRTYEAWNTNPFKDIAVWRFSVLSSIRYSKSWIQFTIRHDNIRNSTSYSKKKNK